MFMIKHWVLTLYSSISDAYNSVIRLFKLLSRIFFALTHIYIPKECVIEW